MSRENLLRLEPNVSQVADLYSLVGYPTGKKDFPDGIVLSYPSELAKLPHGVLVDGTTGTVRLVSVYNHNNVFFSLTALTTQYGESVLADTINSRDHLFFAGQGIAAIVESGDSNDLWYVQLLPKEITLDDYEAHQGYWQETFAFTP